MYREVIKHGRVEHKVKMSYYTHFGVFYERAPPKTPHQLKVQIQALTPLLLLRVLPWHSVKLAPSCSGIEGDCLFLQDRTLGCYDGSRSLACHMLNV